MTDLARLNPMLPHARLAAASEDSHPAPLAGRARSPSTSSWRRRARCDLVYPANDDAGMPTAPGRQTNVAPACGSFCNWPPLSR